MGNTAGRHGNFRVSSRSVVAVAVSSTVLKSCFFRMQSLNIDNVKEERGRERGREGEKEKTCLCFRDFAVELIEDN